MTTFDRIVATDLTSLARDSNSWHPTVEASLALVEAKRIRAPRSAEPIADPARVHAVRIARLASLATAATASALAIGLQRAGIIDPDICFIKGHVQYGPLRGFVRLECYGAPDYTNWHYAAIAVVVLAAIAYLAANAIALRSADRRAPPAPAALAARVGLARFARLATGLAGLVGVAAVLTIATNLLGLRNPDYCSAREGCIDALFLEPRLIAFTTVGLVLIGKMVATELGSRGWARTPRTWLDASSTVVRITSFTALPTLFGILGFAVGNLWTDFLERNDAGDAYPELSVADRLWHEHLARDLALVVLAILVVAVAIGIACAREARLRRASRWLLVLERPRMFLLGLIIGIATLSIGVRAECGRYFGESTGLESWQIALMFTGSLAMFLVVSVPTLRRRRAEQDHTGYSATRTSE